MTEIPTPVQRALDGWGRDAAHLAAVETEAARLDAQIAEAERTLRNLRAAHAASGRAHTAALADVQLSHWLAEQACTKAGVDMPAEPPVIEQAPAAQGRTVWDDLSSPVWGVLCAELVIDGLEGIPTHSGRICGQPIETEPCPMHGTTPPARSEETRLKLSELTGRQPAGPHGVLGEPDPYRPPEFGAPVAGQAVMETRPQEVPPNGNFRPGDGRGDGRA